MNQKTYWIEYFKEDFVNTKAAWLTPISMISFFNFTEEWYAIFKVASLAEWLKSVTNDHLTFTATYKNPLRV